MSGLSRPKAVIFDWDSTLVDNWGGFGLALNATFRAFDKPEWDRETILENTKLSLRNAFPTHFGDRWEEARDVFYKMFEKYHLEDIQPMPGVPEMLPMLANSDLVIGIVSNKNGNYLRIEADHMGWTDHFHAIIGAQDAERDKPAPDPVHLALEGSGVSADRSVWCVGDNPVDLECAHNVGCVGILVDVHDHDEAAVAHAPPDLRVKDCFELAELLAP